MRTEHVEGSTADWTEIRTLPVGILNVDPAYQRYYHPSWSKKIATNFTPDLLDVIHVSQRDGHYWVFDGQHRMNAIKIKFHDDSYPIVCKIYHGLTREEEAELFYKFNTSKKKMSAADMLKSQAVYGDEEVTAFLKHTADAGFVIDPAKRVNCRYGIQATRKAQTLFSRLGAEVYDRMLKILKATWNGEQWSVSQKMLGGMGAFLQAFGDKIDDDKFVTQLKNITENQIEKEAGRYTDETVPVAYASALVNYYNKNLRNGKLKRSRLLDD